MRRLNDVEKDVVKLCGQLAAVKAASKSLETAASTANEKAQKNEK